MAFSQFPLLGRGKLISRVMWNCLATGSYLLAAAQPMNPGDQREPGILEPRYHLPKIINCAELNKSLIKSEFTNMLIPWTALCRHRVAG